MEKLEALLIKIKFETATQTVLGFFDFLKKNERVLAPKVPTDLMTFAALAVMKKRYPHILFTKDFAKEVVTEALKHVPELKVDLDATTLDLTSD